MSSRRSERSERVSGSTLVAPEASLRAGRADPDTRYRSCGMTLVLFAFACHSPPSLPVSAVPPPVVLNFDHLQHLTRDAIVESRSVRVIALYANAPTYRP